MAELATIARPYAEAAFELAKDSNTLDQWSSLLNLLTLIVSDADVASAISNPKVEKSLLTQLVLDICDGQVDSVGQSFIKVLIDARRLAIVGQIAQEFEVLKSQYQGKVKVEVISTFEVLPDQQQQIQTILQRRLGKSVDIMVSTDQSLMGGWIVRAGDQVIDLSVKGRFQQLATQLRR